MQDFRPRLSATYQPRQSLSHLVSKFEDLDRCPRPSSYAPPPRRAETLPSVTPGHWLSSSVTNEKQPTQEPEVPSASTFGQRHKSVAERRKLFESADPCATTLANEMVMLNIGSKMGTPYAAGTRVFSRDVAGHASHPETISQISLPTAWSTTEPAEGRNPSEGLRQVRRMPRLEITRNKTAPSNSQEWPLKSESPLRASIDSYRATETSFEWKPTPARQRSLSRRREPVSIRGETSHPGKERTGSFSGESRSFEEGGGTPPSDPRVGGKASTELDTSGQESEANLILTEEVASACHTVSASRDSVDQPRLDAGFSSIGFPSTHAATPPGVSRPLLESKSHSVLYPPKNSGSWAAKAKSSPLKEKIGIFESLSRQSSVTASNKTPLATSKRSPASPPHVCSPQSSHTTVGHRTSLGRTADRIRTTLRKISLTWERGQVNRIHTSSKENTSSCRESQDVRYTQEARISGRHSYIPALSNNGATLKGNIGRIFGSVSLPSGRTTTIPSEIRQSPQRCRPQCKPTSTDPDSGFSAGLGAPDSNSPVSAQSAPAAAVSRLDNDPNAESRQSNGNKRWVSPSRGGAMFARVQCRLEQPAPVRGDELKRLMTFCKDSALRRRSRGQTE